MEKIFVKKTIFILKKLFYVFFLSYLKFKFKFIKNKNVIILGSAPHVNLNGLNLNEYLVVSCNGSAKNISNLNLKEPSFTVIDNELIDQDIAFNKKVRSNILNNNLLKNLNLGHLISVQSNLSTNSSPEILNSNFNSFIKINKNVRKIIINDILNLDYFEINDNSLISTGAFAISLCFYFGASKVFFSGFSLINSGKNHFYDDNKFNSDDIEIRNHSLADATMIGLMKIQGYNLETFDKDFLILMSNWNSG